MGSGIGKQVGTIKERVEEHDIAIPKVVEAIQQVYMSLSSRIDNSDKTIMALVEVVGKELVAAKLEENLKKEITGNVAKAEKELQDAVTAGHVRLSTEPVTGKSLVVGVEYQPNGEVAFPGRAQLLFENFTDDVQALILGKSIGTTVDLVNGGKFEIKEVYESIN